MRSRFRQRPDAHEGADEALVDVFFGEPHDNRSSRNADRRLKQLCREVYRVLTQVLPGGVDDPLLGGVTVVEVYPAPDAARLAVQVRVEPGAEVAEVVEHLKQLRGYFRAEVAAAIQRKRTPELLFEVVP